MKVEEMIAVMQAYADGKTIERRVAICENNEWEITHEPSWDWSSCEYRIKPEPPRPKHIPYKTIEELDEALTIHSHVAVSKISGVRYAIVSWEKSSFDDQPILTMFLGRSMTTKEFLDDFTWLDGTPCGKEVEDGM